MQSISKHVYTEAAKRHQKARPIHIQFTCALQTPFTTKIITLHQETCTCLTSAGQQEQKDSKNLGVQLNIYTLQNQHPSGLHKYYRIVSKETNISTQPKLTFQKFALVSKTHDDLKCVPNWGLYPKSYVYLKLKKRSLTFLFTIVPLSDTKGHILSIEVFFEIFQLFLIFNK